MWEDNIPVEVAISIVNWDKTSSWHELLENYRKGIIENEQKNG